MPKLKDKDKASRSHLHRSPLEGLDDLQTRLFLHLTEAKEEPTIFSLSGLAEELECDFESVVSALDELQKKGYIRYKRVSEEKLPKVENIKDSSVRNFKRLFSTTDQIDILLRKKNQVSDRVYSKILEELLNKLTEAANHLETARFQAKAELDRIESRIVELQDSMAETCLKIEIKAIDEREGGRIVESYKEELNLLEEQRRSLVDLFGLSVSGASIEMSELNFQKEILRTRMEVGEISEEEYRHRIEELDESLRKASKDTLILKKAETLAKLKEFQREGILPEKLAQTVISELEKFTRSSSLGDSAPATGDRGAEGC